MPEEQNKELTPLHRKMQRGSYVQSKVDEIQRFR